MTTINMNIRYKKTAGKGAALLVVLFIVMVITVLSLGFLSRSDVELACGTNMVTRTKMDYLAESGLEHAKGLILNPQDISSEYWTGGSGQQLVTGSDEYYDLEVLRDPNDNCNYNIDCNAYRFTMGELSGFSGVRANLRLDPCITLWTGANTVISNGITINGDVFCNGSLTNAGSIDGDVFANSLIGDITGQRYAISKLSLDWPELTIEGFTSNYSVDTISSGSISGQTRGSFDPVRICYRGSDLELAGNVQINSMLLVDGDLVISNNTNIITAAKNLPALFVTGDLITEAGGELQVNGLAVVNGNMPVSAGLADVSILGGLFVQGAVYEATSDSSGNGNEGRLYGGTTWLPTSGKFNGAASFDGSDDKIENDDSIPASLNGLSAITLSLWVKSDVTYQNRDILFTCEPTGADEELGIRYDRSGASGGGVSGIKASIKTTSGYTQIESSSYVQTISWQHLALTWQDDPNDPNDSNLKLYIDGNLDSDLQYDSGPVSGVITGIQKLMLGCGTMNKYWDGLMDDVRIYSRALTAPEINDIYGGAAVSDTDLILYWNFDESGSSITITAAPSKTAINIWSDDGDIEKWGQAAGAFFRSIERK